MYKRQLFGGNRNGGGGGAGSVKTPSGTSETGVAAAAGAGASDGLPTTDDNGEISMTLHQINQDGAGPFTAMVDATSGGTDPAAFQKAEVTQNVPGLVAGISTTTTTDFPVKVQMPQGMTCSGTVAGAENVCVVKMQNATPAGQYISSSELKQLLTIPQVHSVVPVLSHSQTLLRSVPSSTTSASAEWHEDSRPPPPKFPLVVMTIRILDHT